MLVVNEHSIQTIEDILWVFVPTTLESYYEVDLWEDDVAKREKHRALWLPKVNQPTPFVELEYHDGQQYDFSYYVRFQDAGDCALKEKQHISSLVHDLYRWHLEHVPSQIFNVGTKPDPMVMPWKGIKGLRTSSSSP